MEGLLLYKASFLHLQERPFCRRKDSKIVKILTDKHKNFLCGVFEAAAEEFYTVLPSLLAFYRKQKFSLENIPIYILLSKEGYAKIKKYKKKANMQNAPLWTAMDGR